MINNLTVIRSRRRVREITRAAKPERGSGCLRPRNRETSSLYSFRMNIHEISLAASFRILRLCGSGKPSKIHSSWVARSLSRTLASHQVVLPRAYIYPRPGKRASLRRLNRGARSPKLHRASRPSVCTRYRKNAYERLHVRRTRLP